MPIQVKKSKGVCHIGIDDEMTIYTAASLKNDLIHELTDNNELEISLEKVSEIDSAGVQIMLLLHRTAQKEDRILHFTHHSECVIEVLETLNLVAHFGDPIVIAAEG